MVLVRNQCFCKTLDYSRRTIHRLRAVERASIRKLGDMPHTKWANSVGHRCAVSALGTLTRLSGRYSKIMHGRCQLFISIFIAPSFVEGLVLTVCTVVFCQVLEQGVL